MVEITPRLLPDTDDAAALEAGRHLFAQPCDFIFATGSLDMLPEAGLPEICFAGRSNVGKSSLINALTGRRTLARTSNTPGRTQQLIFFDLGARLRLVDMPGYGYAEVPKEVREAWTTVIKGFLRGRVPLKRALVLVDARHGLKDSDKEMMKLLDGSGVAFQMVLTKADKLKPPALRRVLEETAKALVKHPAAHPEVVVTSSETGAGIPELRASLAALAD
ncbi:MAG: ribosome biogenesis GTP-binding protein YihA/YsxC [Rhodospirillales bacterium]|jgi:GTP-binding protein